MIKKILHFLKNNFFRSYFYKIDISNNIKLPKNSFLKNSKLRGNVICSEGVKIYKAEIEGNVTIDKFTSLWGPNIFISSHLNKIQIGKYCSFAKNVSIYNDNHNYKRPSTYYFEKNIMNKNQNNDLNSKSDIYIGNDVWIGANCTILSGVKIGNGVIVGANSVVTKNLDDYGIYAGNPAKLIKFRFDKDTIEYLHTLQWWNWSIDKLKANSAFFNSETYSDWKSILND